MKDTTLYLYEFNTDDFALQDAIAGYYISKKMQKPINKYRMDDLFLELFKRNVELRVVDNLWCIADRVKSSSLNWSLCRLGFAQPRI